MRSMVNNFNYVWCLINSVYPQSHIYIPICRFTIICNKQIGVDKEEGWNKYEYKKFNVSDIRIPHSHRGVAL
jgi:hypothetical protein